MTRLRRQSGFQKHCSRVVESTYAFYSRIVDDIAETAEEMEADEAERNCDELMKLKNEFEQLFDDITQGRILDGSDTNSFNVAMTWPSVFEIPFNASPQQREDPTDPDLIFLRGRLEQLQTVADQAAAELECIQQDCRSCPLLSGVLPWGTGLSAAFAKLADLERQAIALIQQPSGPWSVESLVRYFSEPGPISSQLLNAMTFDLSGRVLDRKLRQTRFLSSRSFQVEGFRLKVRGMNSLPHMMIFDSEKDVEQWPPSMRGSLRTVTANSREQIAVMKQDKLAMNHLAPECIPWRARVMGHGLTEVRLSWCCAMQLFETGHNQLKILRSVTITNGNPSPLDTVLGRGIVAKAWEDSQWEIRAMRVLDGVACWCAVTLVSNFRNLDYGDGDVSQNGRDCSNQVTYLAFHSIFSISSLFFEVLESAHVFGWTVGLCVYLHFWNWAVFMLELYNGLVCLLLVVVLVVSPSANIYTLMFQYPVLFSISVLFRILTFLVRLLSAKIFAKVLLPAAFAIVSSDSITFLIFMLLLFLGMTNAYWVLPIADNARFSDTILKIFRLGALGNFDLNDLEGANQVIEMGETVKGVHVTMLQDPEAGSQGSTAYFHNGVRFIFVLFSVVSTIMLMNVYIGVLGGEYDKRYNVSKRGLAFFRARIALNVLLRQRCRRRRIYGDSCNYGAGVGDKRGVFISRSLEEFQTN
eukprot:TRINITY_DN3905_c0_g1_i2.p1 TRINITY_DN3905_c0_g1~~TRINITY_DN3905_c0_g1_i2.p1  ORF type:complete len:696 (+),score=84.58 TRINITY_DN3905_c0_g1_i2:122-2209(+)